MKQVNWRGMTRPPCASSLLTLCNTGPFLMLWFKQKPLALAFRKVTIHWYKMCPPSKRYPPVHLKHRCQSPPKQALMFLPSALFQVLSPNLLPPVKGVASEEQRESYLQTALTPRPLLMDHIAEGSKWQQRLPTIYLMEIKAKWNPMKRRLKWIFTVIQMWDRYKKEKVISYISSLVIH